MLHAILQRLHITPHQLMEMSKWERAFVQQSMIAELEAEGKIDT